MLYSVLGSSFHLCLVCGHLLVIPARNTGMYQDSSNFFQSRLAVFNYNQFNPIVLQLQQLYFKQLSSFNTYNSSVFLLTANYFYKAPIYSQVLTTESQSGRWVPEKHPGASTISSQPLDEDHSPWLANPGNLGMSPHPARTRHRYPLH